MRLMGQRSWAQGEPLVAIDLPTPEPSPRQLRVRVRAIGVNPVDWKMRSAGPLRLAARLVGPPPPVVVGVDFAGEVDALGAEVQGFSVGDRVVGGTDFSRKQRGSYADTVFVEPDQVAKLPAGFDLVVAGALPVVGVTAWMSLVEIGALTAGQKVLVLGASGGVGQFAVQLARLRGASAVGVCSTRNVELVRGLGAEAVLDYTKGDPLAAARSLGPFQVVLDAAGGYSGRGCRALLAPGGRHVMVAGTPGQQLRGRFFGPIASRSVLGRSTTPRLEAVVDAVARGGLVVAIAERLPLAEAKRAHERSRSGRMTGKIVLIPD